MTADSGNKIARQFGIVFTLSDSLKPIYDSFGIDIPKANGDTTFELPVPATYIIDTDGTAKTAYINVDHTKRLDPEDIISTLLSLR